MWAKICSSLAYFFISRFDGRLYHKLQVIFMAQKIVQQD